MIIFHNNRCSKSREALEILKNNNCLVEVRDYLKIPPTQKEIKNILKLLNCKAIDLVRKNELLFIEHFKDKKITNAKWIELLCMHPILIERPIVITDKRAIIGRPPTLVLDLIKSKT